MTKSEIPSLSEKKRELESQIELMDDPAMGTEDYADELREEREELGSYTPDQYRLTQELFALREERDELAARIDNLTGGILDASEEQIEELRGRREQAAERMKKKQNRLRVETAMKNATEITGGDR